VLNLMNEELALALKLTGCAPVGFHEDCATRDVTVELLTASK